MPAGSPVAVVKACSEWLENTFIAVFFSGSELSFQGCLEARVLAGLLECNGFVLKPSKTYHSVFSPSTHSRLICSPMDLDIMDDEFSCYLEKLRDPTFCFKPASLKGAAGSHSSWVYLDLSQQDTDQLNGLIGNGRVAAVTLIRELQSLLVTQLNVLGNDVLRPPSPVLFPGFETVSTTDAKHPVLRFPPEYFGLAWNIMSPKTVTMVCGEAGSGKSTLCRFLVNYLLNRFSSVSYLECDVGQTEFTVSGVVGLYVLTKPVLGPAFTHPLPAEKAYYFGATTPKESPLYYLDMIRALYSYFKSEVRQQRPNIPLVINTCGWLSDLGAAIFVDLVRLLSPTHIVRFIKPRMKTEPSRDLGPITEDLLKFTPGLITTSAVIVPELQAGTTRVFTPWSGAPTSPFSPPQPSVSRITIDSRCESETSAMEEVSRGDSIREEEEEEEEMEGGEDETAGVGQEEGEESEGQEVGGGTEKEVEEEEMEATSDQSPQKQAVKGAKRRKFRNWSPRKGKRRDRVRMTKATKAWQEATMHKYSSIVFKKLNAKERHKRRMLDKRNIHLLSRKQRLTVSGQCSSVEVEANEQEEPRDSAESEDEDVSVDTRQTFINFSDTEKTLDTVQSGIADSADANRRVSLDSSDEKRRESSGGPVRTDVWRPNPKAVQSCVHVQVRSKTHPVRVQVGRWLPVLSHQVCHLHHSSGPKNSKQSRHLMLIAYFSPLVQKVLELCQHVSQVSLLQDPKKNFLLCAPPLEIPWSDVAVHVLHQKVPSSQILYAMNGKLVGLGRVDPNEIIDPGPKFPGMVKLLKSTAPLIEFIGLGLLRGIDTSKKMFYVTTPEGEERLEEVNTLVLGKSSQLDFISREHLTQTEWPYYISGLVHHQLGWLAWRQT